MMTSKDVEVNNDNTASSEAVARAEVVQIFVTQHAYGDLSDPHMHTEIKINPCMHTGIACHAIPVCIRGSVIPICIRGSVIPICIRGLILIPVCIWELHGVIGSHRGESRCLFLEEVKIIMSTTNKRWI